VTALMVATVMACGWFRREGQKYVGYMIDRDFGSGLFNGGDDDDDGYNCESGGRGILG